LWTLPSAAQPLASGPAEPRFAAFDTSDSAFQPNAAETLGADWQPSRSTPASLGDDRRTLGRFGANLGRSLLGVASRENLRPLLLGALATGDGALLDGRTERYVAGERRFAALGRVGQQLGEPRNLAFTAAAVFAAGRVSPDGRFRAASYDAAQAFVVNGVWTGALKFATRRERPDGSSRLSFPSGHASNAFAWATVAERHYGPRLGVPAYAVAGLIGLSRIEKNVHHLSDVLAGAALGYVVGRTVVRQDGESPRAARRFSLTPTTGPDGRGLGLALSGSF
jgi:membrane-associated phospholipid phosphatase